LFFIQNHKKAQYINLTENAKNKLKNKGCNAIILNDVSKHDLGFKSGENEVTRVTHTALNGLAVCLMVLDTTFNNILAISWRSVLFMVVRFTTTYAISVYHHLFFSTNFDQDEVYSIM
jgi:hypothetical protein